jgi:hypothetical protein
VTWTPVGQTLPRLCPRCLEREITGRAGGGKTQLLEEVLDGVKTGKSVGRMELLTGTTPVTTTTSTPQMS